MNKFSCLISDLEYRLERNSSCDKFKMDTLNRNKGRCTQLSVHCLIKQTPHFRICEFLLIILCSLRLLLGFPAHSVCPAELTICCAANQAMVCTGENFPGFLLHSASSKCSACRGNTMGGSQNIRVFLQTLGV